MESNNHLVTKDTERIKAFFNNLDMIYARIEKAFKKSKPSLNGQRYLDDKEVAEILHVSRRTLHDWRTNGIIGYIKVSGKILYRESDILKLLEDNYYEPYKKQ